MAFYNILVPVDFSDNSVNALQWGCDIAKRTGAKLHVLHCYEDSMVYANADYIALTDTLSESITKNKLKELRALKKEVPKLTEVKTHFAVTFGFPLKDITEYAEKNSIDLIIMSTLGHKNVLNRLMGSVTAGVIEATTIPVLAIPENFTPKVIKDIVFADDFKAITPEAALHTVASIATLYNAMLRILNITKDGNGAEVDTDEALNIARAFKKVPHVYAFTAGKQSEKGILSFLEKEAPDLLVMVPRKHGFFFNLFRQSVTDYVVHRIKIPMLAVKG